MHLRNNPRLLAPLLAGLAMIAPFSIDTMFPAFHTIERDFAVSPLAMQQTLSIYLASFAFMSLFHGSLSDAFGRRSVLLVNLVVFVFASIGCAEAPSLPVLLVFRALQGFSAGAGSVIGRAVIRDRFEGPDATRLMSQVTLIFGLAPAIAPIFGGWMLGVAGWRAIFWALTAFAAAIATFAYIALPETHPVERRMPFSPTTLMNAYRTVLGDRRSLLLAGAAALNYGAIFMFIASAPVIVLDWLKLNEREFAWLFVPTIGGLMLGAMISGRLAGGRSPATIVRLSFLVIGAGSVIGVLSSALLPPMIPWTLIQPTLIATGAAISAPTMVLMMLDRFPQIRGTVASLQAATTLTCNAIVSGLISPLVSAHPLWLSLGTAALNVVAAGLWAVYHWRPGPDRVAQSA